MEFSEEEKILISMLNIVDTYIDGTKVTKVIFSMEDAKVLYDLIRRQQKEIEEKNCLIDVLQHRIEELLDNKKEINYIKPIDIPVHNYTSRDKIREKIKEIESYAFTSKEEKNQQDYAIERIRELLEENK